MLLVHQTGSVRVGEVVRYTLTYTPSLDRILPPPTHLHVKIKNTAAIPLRAAYLHGPYTLYVACYPSTFDPYKKHERTDEEGAPEFEPQLKAGGNWHARLVVPEDVRNDANYPGGGARDENGKGERKSFTWIIEVASQVIFSKTARVHYELLVGRDEKSLELGFHGVIGSGHGAPGKLEDHQQGRSRNAAQPKGVFSKAVRLVVDDTESLWNSPPIPQWENGEVKVEEGPQHGDKRDHAAKPDKKQRKRKKIHLVLLTHGLHSNLGADMLYIKESIDTAAKQAREDAKKRRAERRAHLMAESNRFGREALKQRSRSVPEQAIAGTASTPEEALDANAADETEEDEEEEEEEEEEVFVRGFNGNAVKTERGIQYLGKRFAKYVLSITYPDQPYLPVKSSIGKSITKTLTPSKPTPTDGMHPTHKNSSIIKDENHRNHDLPYTITSISFISHSLGGLIQTYAIAYIQKHAPEFFDIIKPVNFVAMASPFLGLSNENPIYVKFALDFGLVGRSGQDLGLTWRTPTLAKSGWGAVIGGLTAESQKAQKEPDPGAKPLLRILPTGPAHIALKKFRNRTVYSNVVNDGIVPLRTSCLLFLDWRGLGRVDKARRENGLVGTMVGWGWAEMMGQNASAPRKQLPWNDLFSDSGDDVSNAGKSSPDPESSVPQADASQAFDYDQRAEPEERQFLQKGQSSVPDEGPQDSSTTSAPNLWSGLLNLFKPQAGQQKPEPKGPRKTQKIYHRGQTMHHREHDSRRTSGDGSQDGNDNEASSDENGGKGRLVRGSSLYTNNSETGEMEAPPRTTFFESAGDVLNPPLPPREFLLDPGARPRTIWHDRVYHPQDIPPPPVKPQRTFMRKRSAPPDGSQPSLSNSPSIDTLRPQSSQSIASTQSTGTMKIEEKIARAYHKDMSWRKVLVRLEPDAHNNMIVRRMFANAYGWPVVKHMCDTHFAYTMAAQTRDEDEPPIERAKASDVAVREDGEQVKGQTDLPPAEIEDDKIIHSVRNRKPERARTTDASPRSVDEEHEDLQRIQSRWSVKDRVLSQRLRTESEIRESRDDVSELVSRVSVAGQSGSGTSYSSMNSSKAALSRLARQDSDKWSDRFFEGSDADDDEDEETLREELRRAQQRGELGKSNYRTKAGAMITDTLTSSPQSTQLGRVKGKAASQTNRITEPETLLTAEPAELEPSSQSSGTTTTRSPSTEDLTLPTLSPVNTGASLGLSLGESVEERQHREMHGGSAAGPFADPTASTSPKERKGSLGVAEQVALAQGRELPE